MDSNNINNLWLEIKSGSRRAFDELITSYWEVLFNSAYKRIDKIEVCQDIVQDIFLYLWKRREHLEIDNLEAYLRTAVRYRVYSYYSRNKVKTEFVDSFESIITSPYKAESKLLHNDLRELVRSWIDSLPSKRKKVFELYLENNMTTKEIAKKLNVSQKTVQNHLNLSMGDLRNSISKDLTLLFYFF